MTDLKYDHLVGLQFDIEKRNCYSLLRDFYRDNYQIELTDYACPTEWWRSDLDLYSKLASTEGFDIVQSALPRDWQPGDVIVMAIDSSSGNHCAILLDNGKILHHLVGQLSRVTEYGGLFRNNTVAVYRHRLVPAPDQTKHLVDIRKYLRPHVLHRLEEIEASQKLAAQEAGGGT